MFALTRPRLLLRYTDAAMELSATLDDVRELVARGELKVVKLPSDCEWRIPYSELVEWVKRNTKAKAELPSTSADRTREIMPRDRKRSRQIRRKAPPTDEGSN